MRVELKPSGPLVIEGKSDVVLTGLNISSTSGDCVIIRNSQRVTIANSHIGPCGGRGFEVARSSDVRIMGNYIHPEFNATSCCDRGDGVFVYLTDRLVLQDNVIAYGETNVELMGVTNAQVFRNRLINPRGPHPRGQQVQVWAHGSVKSADVLIQGNVAISADDYKLPEGQWDAINVGMSDRVRVEQNYISGGRSQSGCGIVVDVGANSVQMMDNTLVHTGQCGIGIGSGTYHLISGNRIYNHGLDLLNVGNTAIYVWKQYAGACGPVQVVNNTAVTIRPNGQLSSFWDGGGCGPVSQQGNVYDSAAVTALSPTSEKMQQGPAPVYPHWLDSGSNVDSGPGYLVAR
jgi:nitrous oxidase accessory protein NosD